MKETQSEACCTLVFVKQVAQSVSVINTSNSLDLDVNRLVFGSISLHAGKGECYMVLATVNGTEITIHVLYIHVEK